jgi:hypothetical protein
MTLFARSRYRRPFGHRATIGDEWHLCWESALYGALLLLAAEAAIAVWWLA